MPAVATTALVGAAIAGLIVLTWDQCRIPRSSETLWTHVLDHGGGGNSTPHWDGVGPLRPGAYDEAARALRAEPPASTPAVPGTLRAGIVYYLQGRLDEAIAEYEEAIRLEPEFAQAHSGLGVGPAPPGATR